MALGLPVIAYKSGGALDYVVPRKTGQFFNKQTTESLVISLKKFGANRYDSTDIISVAQLFSNNEFSTDIKKFIKSIT